jgi:D-alanyl-D-alanine carboxypeptidase
MSEKPADAQRRQFLASLITTGCAMTIPVYSVFAESSVSNTKPINIAPASAISGHLPDSAIRDAIRKAENFEADYDDDVYLDKIQNTLLISCLQRLSRLQQVVGYANFSLLSFDDARRYAQAYSVIGEFSRQELEFIEFLYSVDAIRYGFLGRKVSASLTDTIRDRDVYKVQGTGQYLYKGDALATYQKMQKQLGQQLELTSGIRSVVKQLFMAKAEKSDGNLSRAARSLAPPGHSFHGIGDFDVGQRGLGAANFTNAFAQTDIYQRLRDMNLISMRYPFANPYGVRYEPWHIKVVKDA